MHKRFEPAHPGSTNHSSISAEESEGSIRLPVGL